MVLYPFMPYTCPSTPWWHSAPPKHELGLHAQEPHLHEAAQADRLGNIPANPVATSQWPLCAAARCPSHHHPAAPVQFLRAEEVRSVKLGVDARCILNTPTRTRQLRCIPTSRITSNLHNQAERGSFLGVTSTMGKRGRARLPTLESRLCDLCTFQGSGRQSFPGPGLIPSALPAPCLWLTSA